MGKFGFKEITFHNWMQPGENLKYFKKITSNGQLDTISAQDYLQKALDPKLQAVVPDNIQSLFEVARGAVIYAYFFYPLYALAGEQLFRVAEAACTQLCKHMGVPRDKKRFVDRIKWLTEKGIITEAEASQWHNIRHLRNAASHPQEPMIDTPMDALGILANLADEINSLFGKY